MERIYTNSAAIHSLLKELPSKQSSTTPFAKRLNIRAKAFWISFIFIGLIGMNGWGQTTTPARNAATGTNVTGVGAKAWTSPGNIVGNENSYATVSLNNQTSNYLQATGYGFSIPSEATINGITVTIGRYGSTGGGADVRDNVVSMIKDGNVVTGTGSNLAVTGIDWGNSETAIIYGATTNKWGTTWTPAQINASNFGVALAVYSSNNRTAYVDYITISVTFTGTYKSQWISMNTGSSTWCAGETRTVTVTLKNNGTNTWTDGWPDINIGVKWNGDADYYIRTDAGNLAPGATNTYSFLVTAPAAGNNNLTFDAVYEQLSWFAGNGGGVGPGNAVYASSVINIATQAAPTGNASQIFCSSSNPTVADLTATGSNILWYDAATGGNLLASSTALVNGTHYYASQTVTCESPLRLDVTATVITAPTTTGITICQGGSGSLTSSTTCPAGSSTNTGAKNAGTGTNVDGPGTIAWTNPSNISADDANYSSATLPPNGVKTEYIQGTNYGFTIPTNATISGIVVTIMRQSDANGGGNSINDDDLYLLKAGNLTGSDKATTTDWPTTMGSTSYGGVSDLWGSTWTPSDINAVNFGVSLSAVTQAINSNRTASVDYMQITVYYTTPSGILEWYTASSGGTSVQSGSPFNPIGDAEVIAAGGIYANLTNTNTPGTYTFYAECSTNPGCRTAAEYIIGPNTSVWQGEVSEIWSDKDNWDPKYVPVPCTDVTIPANADRFPTITSNAYCNNIKLESDASLIDQGSFLTVTNKSTMIREISDTRWHFLSSPVEEQKIWPAFAPTPTDDPLTFGEGPWLWDFYYYNPNCPLPGKEWVNLRNNNGTYNSGAINAGSNFAGFGPSIPTMTVAKGYLVAYASGSSTHAFDASTPNSFHTGDIGINFPNSVNVYNLIGNPYPSSLDWMYSGWNFSDLEKSGVGYDYWIMNDGVGTISGNYVVFNSGGTGSSSVSKDIAPGQAFWVKAKATGTLILTIPNAARTHSTQAWLKNSNLEANLIRLHLKTSGNTYSDEMIVDINPAYSGTEGSDKLWSFYTEAPEIYSIKGGNNYTIDRYKDLNTNLTVNIGTKTGITADYTITATNIQEFNLSSKVLLEDLKTGVVTDLKQTPAYTFAGAPGDDANRFRLIIGSPIGIDEPNTTGSFNIYTYENMVYVQNDKINEPYFVTVSNMLGQTLVRTDFTGNSLNRIEMQNVPGVYVVNVVSNGKTYSQKVVIR